MDNVHHLSTICPPPLNTRNYNNITMKWQLALTIMALMLALSPTVQASCLTTEQTISLINITDNTAFYSIFDDFCNETGSMNNDLDNFNEQLDKFNDSITQAYKSIDTKMNNYFNNYTESLNEKIKLSELLQEIIKLQNTSDKIRELDDTISSISQISETKGEEMKSQLALMISDWKDESDLYIDDREFDEFRQEIYSTINNPELQPDYTWIIYVVGMVCATMFVAFYFQENIRKKARIARLKAEQKASGTFGKAQNKLTFNKITEPKTKKK